MPAHTTYLPFRNIDLDASFLNLSVQGVSGAAAPNTDTVFSYLLTGDVIFSGADIVVAGNTFGDYISAQVVDVNNILGFGANFVVKRFVNQLFVGETSYRLSLQGQYPVKIPAGLYIQVTYTSTNLLIGAHFSVNYLLHNVLF